METEKGYPGAYPHVDLLQLYAAIEHEFKTRYPTLQTVEFHRGTDGAERLEIPVPALLLEDETMEPDQESNAGDEMTHTNFSFSAYLILSNVRNPQVRKNIRVMAADMVNFINQHRWRGADGKVITADPCVVTVAERDNFDPSLDKYEVWRIDWTQGIALGESVWKGDDIPPGNIYIGFSPDIGLTHKDDYQLLGGTDE